MFTLHQNVQTPKKKEKTNNYTRFNRIVAQTVTYNSSLKYSIRNRVHFTLMGRGIFAVFTPRDLHSLWVFGNFFHLYKDLMILKTREEEALEVNL